MRKNILIIGINSELALRTLEELNKDEYKIYATSRHVGLINENITEFNLDINNEMDFIKLKEKIHNIKFSTIINSNRNQVAACFFHQFHCFKIDSINSCVC